MPFYSTATEKLKKWPLHIFLLPAFFMLHNYLNLATIVPQKYFIKNFLVLTASLVTVFLLLRFYYKDNSKAGFLTTFLGVLFLFFGQIKDFMFSVPLLALISSYKILLPLLLLISVLCIYKTKRVKSLARLTVFLNILFTIYIIIELFNLSKINKSSNHHNPEFDFLTTGISSDSLPSIYYIVLDGYPSSSFLKEKLKIDANTLDTNLINRNFFIAKKSNSSYNYTAFSIASIFTMSYLPWIKNISYNRPEDYNKAVLLIKNAPLFGWLQKNGYTINNYSFFDIGDKKSFTDKKFFYVISPDIVFRNTLWNKIKWEVLPTLFPSFLNKLYKEQVIDASSKVANYKNYDSSVYSLLIKETASIGNNRFFTYAHFEMPHSPYLYDSSGKGYSVAELYESDKIKRREMYINYISYVNKKITIAIDSIFSNCYPPPIIILQSDHGCREGEIATTQEDYFRNYSAFYFPDKDYSMLSDSINNTNTFRVISNKFFKQKLPLLKDTTFYLKF